MLKDILNLEGAQELSKSQQKAVNGGEKCKYTPNVHDGIVNSIDEPSCTKSCRPSFLGIGFGSWEVVAQEVPCP